MLKCSILIVNEMVYLFYIIMTVLSILSWNVRGVISSSLCMNNLLDGHKCDILVSSELRLSERCSIIWNCLHPMYKLCVTHSIMPYIYIFFNSSLTEIYYTNNTPCLCGIRVTQYLVFCVGFCLSLFVLSFFLVEETG
jgi:hypothetical protein